MLKNKPLSILIAAMHLVGVCLAVGTFAFFSRHFIQDRLEHSLQTRLRDSVLIVNRIVSDRMERLQQHVRLAQEDQSMQIYLGLYRNTLDAEARVALSRKTEQLAITSGADLVQLFGSDSRLIHAIGFNATEGADVDIWGLEDSLAGDNVLTLNREGEDLLLRAMGPVRDERGVLGAISFAIRIGPSFLQEISDLIHGEVFILSSNGLVLSGIHRMEDSVGFDRNIAGRVADLRDAIIGNPLLVGEIPYATIYFPLQIADTTVVAAAAFDRSSVDVALYTTTWSILGWGVLVFVIGLGVALLFTRNLIRPLHEIQRAAERISGGDYSVSLATPERPEFALVAKAFNNMTTRLVSTLDELRRSKEWAELLFKLTPSAIFTVDLDQRITSWNNRAVELTGYSEREMLGAECTLFADAPCLDGCGLFNDAIPKPITGRTCVIRRKDGSRLVIAKNVDFIRDPEGAPVGGIETFVDITAQKKIEQELRSAKQTAEKASNAKSEFLANISHEIRTPMSGILGLTELLMETNPSENQRTYLEMMRTSANALRQLIDDVLDLSEIEARTLHLHLGPFNLRSLIDSALHVVRLRAAEKGLAIESGIQKDIPDTLVGDDGKLRQIIGNLLDNALKFTDSGTIRLETSRAETIGDRVRLRFSVSDTGIGIAPETQVHIFDVFTQGDTSTARKHGGSGLGLTISRHLVEMMGGTINVASRPGEGTTFTFTAVFGRPGDEEGGGTRDISGGVMEKAAHQTRPLRILLVEDNAINQTLVLRILEHKGHRVVVRENGTEAVMAAEQGSFDVILMDIQMPEMDGFEATRRIRAREAPEGKRTPIIAMTAHALEGDRKRCIDAGMDDYISKPFHAEHLYVLLDMWTAPGSGRRSASDYGPPGDDGKGTEEHTEGIPAPVLDAAKGLGLLDGDDDMYERLLTIFLKDAPQRLQSAETALATNDVPTAERQFHSLKSMAATIGASRLAGLAQRLETAVATGKTEDVMAMLQEVKEVLDFTIGGVEEFRRTSYK